MSGILKKTKSVSGVSLADLALADLQRENAPVVFKGVLQEAKLVELGIKSPDLAMEYLQKFDAGRPLTRFIGPTEIDTRFGYNSDLTGFNFDRDQVKFDVFLQAVKDQSTKSSATSHYVGSTDLDLYFPRLKGESGITDIARLLEKFNPFVSMWMGNRTTAATHYDMSNNIAACMVGNRRFTLFPPDQISNLYPGPIEVTPGGQVISMVDLNQPDFDKYPNFKHALEAGEVAELEPGDLLYYPALWWHQVEALSDFNVMVNFWWNEAPAFMDSPMLTVMHGMLSLRDRSEEEKTAWRSIMDYYVFGDAEKPIDHLPDHIVGMLGTIDDRQARRLRSELLKRLNR